MSKKKIDKKYPGLTSRGDLKIRHELYDQDYIDKLSDKEKEWLSNFNLEYNSANFDHEGKRIHKEKLRTRKVKSTGKSRVVDVGKKDSFDRNNLRNNDVFAIVKANHMFRDLSQADKQNVVARETTVNNTEDAIIEVLDEFNAAKKT